MSSKDEMRELRAMVRKKFEEKPIVKGTPPDVKIEYLPYDKFSRGNKIGSSSKNRRKFKVPKKYKRR